MKTVGARSKCCEMCEHVSCHPRVRDLISFDVQRVRNFRPPILLIPISL